MLSFDPYLVLDTFIGRHFDKIASETRAENDDVARARIDIILVASGTAELRRQSPLIPLSEV